MPTNRLAQEKSPYLLQHAHNPVDWYPWGEEAFEKARTEDKPIFLSVGYSTCHWCHVMERESFENAAFAEILNQHFVPVKVDREERPDVDRIYMLFVQATTGGGGWPMSVWLTPDRKPFFGGTYFPPENRFGRPGFGTILEHIAGVWKQDRAKMGESADEVLRQLRDISATRGRTELNPSMLDAGFEHFQKSFDEQNGGFGGAPKFPRPSVLNFLLRYWQYANKNAAKDMVVKTLTKMRLGGMNDQVGGGFHRYSVDARWFVPHFEKMLYDQAQLATAYLEAFQITEKQDFANEARAILDYVLRDLRHPGGAFYSAEDADSAIDSANPSAKSEGAFYLWTLEEFDEVLGLPEAAWLAYHYGVLEEGNVEPEVDPHHEFTGKNILYVEKSFEETAALFEVHPQEIRGGVAESKPKLLAARQARRLRPHLDDKVLAAWNGLMISAFAKAAMVLEDDTYREAAQQAADFLWQNLWHEERRILHRRFRDGEAAVPGFLDDYAFLASAMADLYEAAFALRFLERAQILTDRMRELFEDQEGGGFFSTTADAAELVMRMKEDHDGAEPSGNSVAVALLLRMAAMLGRDDLRKSADATIDWASVRLAQQLPQMPQMAASYLFSLKPPRQVVLAGEPGTPTDTAEMAGIARRRFAPNQVLLQADPAHPSAAVRAMVPLGGRPTAYVCQNFTCELPVHSIYDLVQALGKK